MQRVADTVIKQAIMNSVQRSLSKKIEDIHVTLNIS